MKNKIRVSSREKMLLIILGIIVVIGVYYKFILSVQMDQIKELNAKLEENQGKISSLNQDKVLNKKIQEDIKIVNAKITEVSEEFFPSIIQEKNLVILDGIINKTNVQCDSIAISEVSDEAIAFKEATAKKKNSLEAMIEEYKALEGENSSLPIVNGESNNAATNNKDKIVPEAKKTSISLNVKGTHDEVMNFIDEVKGFYKRIVIQNINLVAQEDKITANMVLDFYSVPKFIEEDIDYNKWNYDGVYGKSNIFDSNSSGIAAMISQNTENAKEYDFLMTVKPISSDIPTIMLGKSKDTSTKSYVYADNEGIEEVEVHFEKKDDKYYFKYKTTGDSYPDDFTKLIEFSPVSNINLKLYSEKRINDKDLSGSNIKVYNNTDLEVSIDIQGDDENRPRVNIFKEKGNIEINKY